MINNEIKKGLVKVVSDENKGLQEMSLDEAIEIASEQGLDVVCLNDKCDIPIVKIMDYKKYLYEKDKKDKLNRKKARLNSQDIKEICISDSIALHDLKVKASNADRILKGGDKVMLVIKYKGRMVKYINEGPSKLMELEKLITIPRVIERNPSINGNRVTMLISPNK